MRVFRWRAALVVIGGALLGVGACKEDRLALSIDLRTDYVPGAEFSRVITEVTPDGGSRQTSTHPVVATDGGFVAGARVADFGGLPGGGFGVKVSVVSDDGDVLVERLARLSVSSDYALTMVVTRSCAGIVCPIPAGDPARNTCSGGQCVQPECVPDHPELCPEAECQQDTDCHADAACVAARCLAGTCLFVPSDSKCPAGQSCDVNKGCDGGDVAACQPTGGTETSCGDGQDNDCDGDVDCDDSDCETRACDDGDACTTADTCTAGACAGKAQTCDDGNPCTDDACDAKLGCGHSNNAGPCTDGVFCNGADTCSGGACSVHAGAPCAQVCSEDLAQCVGCTVDADCGPAAPGPWSACAFASTCATSGTQTRQLTTPTCSANACKPVVTTETQACSRTTDGVSCQATDHSAWSACGGYANACDTSGTQSRTNTTHACSAGACKPTSTKESKACSRKVSDGTSCGSKKYCCSGSCFSTSDDKHCSSCGVSCGSGFSCKGDGAGHPSCTCVSNASCVSRGFGSGATCYQGFCNCQCSGASCCSGADCHIVNGQNYCGY